MKDRIESAMALIGECEASMARCRGILAELNMERVVRKYAPPEPEPRGIPAPPVIPARPTDNYVLTPDPDLHDEPPSRGCVT